MQSCRPRCVCAVRLVVGIDRRVASCARSASTMQWCSCTHGATRGVFHQHPSSEKMSLPLVAVIGPMHRHQQLFGIGAFAARAEFQLVPDQLDLARHPLRCDPWETQARCQRLATARIVTMVPLRPRATSIHHERRHHMPPASIVRYTGTVCCTMWRVGWKVWINKTPSINVVAQGKTPMWGPLGNRS